MKNSLWDKLQELKKAALSNDVQYLLDRAFAILGNPVAMFGMTYNLIAVTSGVVTDDPLWNELTTTGTFSHESVDFFNRESFIEVFNKSDTVALLKSDKLKYDRVNGKLFDKNNVQIGNISVLACSKPFDENDFGLFEQLCEMLSEILCNQELYSKMQRGYCESQFAQLLGEDADTQRTDEAISALYDNLKSNIFLAVADVSQYERTLTHLMYFADLFKSLQPEYVYCTHLNNIIIIISTDDLILCPSKHLDKLGKFFKEYNIYAGISSGFSNLYELKKYYRQAINALNYGMKSRRNEHINTYDSYRLEHFLSILRLDRADSFFSPVVPLIEEHDRAFGTSLLSMLNLYLTYGGNAAAVCSNEGVSDAELKKALETLKNVFAIDFCNGDMLMNIFITLKFYDNK